jgi:uncharacterized membrane protein
MTEPSETLDTGAMNRLSIRLSLVLSVGVVLSAILLIIGLILVAVTGPVSSTDLSTAWSGPGHSLGPGSALAYGFLLAGIVVLLIIPLARVGVSSYSFAAGGERDFAILTLFVLIVLAISAAASFLLPMIIAP